LCTAMVHTYHDDDLTYAHYVADGLLDDRSKGVVVNEISTRTVCPPGAESHQYCGHGGWSCAAPAPGLPGAVMIHPHRRLAEGWDPAGYSTGTIIWIRQAR